LTIRYGYYLFLRYRTNMCHNCFSWRLLEIAIKFCTSHRSTESNHQPLFTCSIVWIMLTVWSHGTLVSLFHCGWVVCEHCPVVALWRIIRSLDDTRHTNEMPSCATLVIWVQTASVLPLLVIGMNDLSRASRMYLCFAILSEQFFIQLWFSCLFYPAFETTTFWTSLWYFSMEAIDASLL